MEYWKKQWNSTQSKGGSENQLCFVSLGEFYMRIGFSWKWKSMRIWHFKLRNICRYAAYLGNSGLALAFANWANGSRKQKLAKEKSNWLKPPKSTTFRIHCASIRTQSYIRGFGVVSKYFSSICVKMSVDDRGIHNANCENRTPCVFPSQVWHQLISPRGDVNRSLDIQCLRNRDHV